MNRTLCWAGLVAMGLQGCSRGQSDVPEQTAALQEEPAEETDALHKPDPKGTYGEGIRLAETVGIAAILEAPEPFEGKRVLVEGTIQDVCPMAGCWMDVADSGTRQTIRVKVTDGEIVFPLSAKGSSARVEGTVEKIELSEEQARTWMAHEAEEKGEAFDPESVKGPRVIWRLQGHGAEIGAAPQG